jgi:hypothetical protein
MDREEWAEKIMQQILPRLAAVRDEGYAGAVAAGVPDLIFHVGFHKALMKLAAFEMVGVMEAFFDRRPDWSNPQDAERVQRLYMGFLAAAKATAAKELRMSGVDVPEGGEQTAG